MVFLFTVTSPSPLGTRWYARIFTTEISYCYHELTTLIQPYPSNRTLDEWLHGQVHDHAFELAQRRMVLQGYPSYFPRLWERFHWRQHIVGNSDSSIGGMALGLWLLWPEMRFVFSFVNGITEVDELLNGAAVAPASASVFEECCRRWTADVEALEKQYVRLAERGARCQTARLEKVLSSEDALRGVWNTTVGNWDVHSERVLALREECELPNPDEIWARWDPERRSTFVAICGETLTRLGYEIPADEPESEIPAEEPETEVPAEEPESEVPAAEPAEEPDDASLQRG